MIATKMCKLKSNEKLHEIVNCFFSSPKICPYFLVTAIDKT